MLLFLPLALLLVHSCSGINLSNARDITTDAVNALNSFRQQVANGSYGHLPGSLSMFRLKPSAVLNSTALKNVYNCDASSDNIPAGQSINIFITKSPPSGVGLTTLLPLVVKTWTQQLDGIDDNVVYSNTQLKTFANMIYYKSTEVGCYYNQCGTSKHVIACVFDMSPQMNQPLYIPNKGAQGCTSDKSCSEQLVGSTCITSGMYRGLCDSGEETFVAGIPQAMTEEVRDHIIDMHNYRRSRLAQGLVPNGTISKTLPPGTDIAKLQYNTDLEAEAQAYAKTCPTGLSPVSSRNKSGEIYQSFPPNDLPYKDVITRALKASWHPIWKIGFNETLEFTKSLEETPNAPIMFTQMAWSKTHEVGCGAARCSSNTTVICRYSPRGNIAGQKVYTRGVTCSNCTNDCTTGYYKGLCIVQ